MPIYLQNLLRQKKYVPTLTSGYASIMIALLLNDPGQIGLSKGEIKRFADELGMKDMDEVSGPFNSYDCLQGLRNSKDNPLLTGQLVVKTKTDGTMLTDTGVAMARELHNWV